ncbi:hypothetical protein, partial [Mycobacterium tuberculosis]|uniref:hypothetical protein n=1 Tax=Mycobacterium tuberculosis TaxID=1773 RepID=UPI001BE09579
PFPVVSASVARAVVLALPVTPLSSGSLPLRLAVPRPSSGPFVPPPLPVWLVSRSSARSVVLFLRFRAA